MARRVPRPLRHGGPGKATGALLLLLAAGCEPAAELPPTGSAAAPAPPAGEQRGEPEWVGAGVCAECHPEASAAWLGSHHERAMNEASPDRVLGDFEGGRLEHRGVTSRFSRGPDGYRIRTEGPDGRPGDFPVAYTFGVEPLQQYLTPFPGGRYQVLDLAWDSRPASRGGQRWFSLRPDERVVPGDALHWSGFGGNWNAMCADCHSTRLEKGYRAAEGDYRSTWSEPNVACEACHGPGSRHAARARAGRLAGGSGLTQTLQDQGEWRFEGDAPIARRSPPRSEHLELDTCAPCHARRTRIDAGADPAVAFLDRYRPALLAEGLYHADGQILDEVYVWGSFVQSRMHGAGVSCSDCHDPHSLTIDEPDAACGRCHRTEVFAAPAHHRHPPRSEGASCVACHMPARTYMAVDVRRDHSFRVPRPDLSVALGTPNACTDCHTDREAAWAAKQVEGWFGPERRPHFATVLHAGRRGTPGSREALDALLRDREQPAIARATALDLLGRRADAAGVRGVSRGAADPEPLVRMAAAGAADAVPAPLRLRLLAPLLRDPLRAVRIEAARALADAAGAAAPADRAALSRALDEYRRAQALHADRPEAQVNLGLLHLRRGDLPAARAAYEEAIRIGPWFVPAHVNLADLLRRLGRDEEGEAVLRRALADHPRSAELQHALGLTLVRLGRPAEARVALERAAQLAPERPRYAYVHALALHSAGETEASRRVLEEARRRHPQDPEIEAALESLSGP